MNKSDIKPGDYVKVLKNGDFHSIVQVKNVYDVYIETTHGIFNSETLASRVNRNCIISGIVKWEDLKWKKNHTNKHYIPWCAKIK